MKLSILFAAYLPLGLLHACGGDASAQPATAAPAAPTPSVTTPAVTTPAVPTPVDEADAEPQDPQGGQKPIRRPKIDIRLVKTFFGNETAAPQAPVASTPELVALGEALYHDTRLSKDGKVSCATCHDLRTYGVDNKKVSLGTDGQSGERNSPTTWNAFRQFAQFWDGRAKAVEDQALMPITKPVEHGVADEAELVAKLKQAPELGAAFAKAFPGQEDAVTAKNLGVAIGAFERTLVTRSRWDKYLDGDQKALSNEELLGLKNFMEVGCTTCHINRTLGGHMFQKLGLVKPHDGKDTGRMQVTGNAADKFMFKVPSLLNVEKTAPYYHDGSIATLEEAVRDMASVQLGRELTAEQTSSIVAFLNALTGALPEKYATK